LSPPRRGATLGTKTFTPPSRESDAAFFPALSGDGRAPPERRADALSGADIVNIADLRREYMRETLDESDVDPDPVRQFERWFGEATKAALPEPNAMTLATVDPAGRPAARIVLLKIADDRGFVFFTNFASRKGRELEANPRAALLFFWAELERQVRIEGVTAPLDPAESAAYFAGRPRASQLGAWASPQSEPIAGRSVLLARFAEVEARYSDPNRPVPRPPHWGGYRLEPDAIEFWQGRASRLHDRIRYRRDHEQAGAWVIDRLAP
jgi:pyridoxamine 5'-phosphate oxidase